MLVLNASLSSIMDTNNNNHSNVIINQHADGTSIHNLPCFKDLIAVLFECFSIITLGYLSCRFKLISKEAKDLGAYLSTFALPMIIFLNIAQMEFHTINLSFLLCMLFAKLFLFMSVSLLTLAISCPTNTAYAGALSILATQSNDFALGYPLFKSLYGENKPEMLSYLSLMAPIQLLILNPLGIAMLEYEKSKQRHRKSDVIGEPVERIADRRSSCKICHQNQSTPPPDNNIITGRRREVLTKSDTLIEANDNGPIVIVESPKRHNKINLSFITALATNPLIIASVVALAVNLTYGPRLPKFITKVSNTIAASFAAPALFVVGLSMYGKFELILRSPNDLLLSSVLVLTKVVILPSIMRTLTIIVLPYYLPLEELPYLTDFSYLYGLLPTAPTACIIANQYGVLPDVVSISMLLSTFVSAPLMLGASIIISQSAEKTIEDFNRLLSQIIGTSSLMTLLCSTVTVYILWKASRKLNHLEHIGSTIGRNVMRLRMDPIQFFLILITIAQVTIGLGGLFWFLSDDKQNESRLLKKNHLSSLAWLQPGASNRSRSAIPASTIRTQPVPHPIIYEEDEENMNVLFSPEFRLKSLCPVQYILASLGLLLSKYIVFSILVICFTRTFYGIEKAYKISLFMLKMGALFVATSLIWLTYEAKDATCLPFEASMPDQYLSIWVRLIYNGAFFVVSMTLLVSIFKAENKLRFSMKSVPEPEFMDNEDSVAQDRRFFTSCASLTSDTSSTTTHTNLESTPPISGEVSQMRLEKSHNSKHLNHLAPIVLDCRYLESIKQLDGDAKHDTDQVVNCTSQPIISNVTSNIVGDNQHDADLFSHQQLPNTSNNPECDLERQVTSHNPNAIPTHQYSNVKGATEFRKHSILIVFMLLMSILKLTTLVQILNQEELYGTFKQGVIITSAVEFGQGLMTFLLYGLRSSCL